MKRKNVFLFFILVFLLIISSGCAEQQENSKALKIGIASDIGNLDPLSPDSSHSAIMLVFENLVRKEGSEYKPVLAEGWSVSPNQKMWEFKLRSGVKFSDGSLCDSQAVKFSLDRLSVVRKGKGGLADLIEKIEVIDKNKVRIILKKSYAPFLDDLCRHSLVIVSPNCVSPIGSYKGKWLKPIGTGPFILQSYKADQEVMFNRNEKYWGEKAKVPFVELKIIADEESRALALEGRQIDLVYANWDGHGATFPYQRAKNLESKGFKIVTGISSIHKVLVFNTFKEPLKNSQLRAYLSSIILEKRKEMVQGLLVSGEGEMVNSLFPETTGWLSSLKDKGKTVKMFHKITEKLRFLVCSSEPHDLAFAQLVQAYLAEKNITVEIQQTDISSFWDLVDKKDYDLTIVTTMGLPYDPWGMLNWAFNNDNPSIYSNQELAKQIDILMQSTAEKKLITQKKIDYILAKSYSFLPLYREVNFAVMNPTIKDFKLISGQSIYLPWSQVEKVKQ